MRSEQRQTRSRRTSDEDEEEEEMKGDDMVGDGTGYMHDIIITTDMVIQGHRSSSSMPSCTNDDESTILYGFIPPSPLPSTYATCLL